MSVILPSVFTTDNVNYNLVFSDLAPKLMEELRKGAKAEAIGNKPVINKAEQYVAAINYVYSLYTISQYSQDLDFWKEKMKYEEVKNCFYLKGINTDELLNILQQ